jgi:hypothetical protein
MMKIMQLERNARTGENRGVIMRSIIYCSSRLESGDPKIGGIVALQEALV